MGTVQWEAGWEALDQGIYRKETWYPPDAQEPAEMEVEQFPGGLGEEEACPRPTATTGHCSVLEAEVRKKGHRKASQDGTNGEGLGLPTAAVLSLSPAWCLSCWAAVPLSSETS